MGCIIAQKRPRWKSMGKKLWAVANSGFRARCKVAKSLRKIKIYRSPKESETRFFPLIEKQFKTPWVDNFGQSWIEFFRSVDAKSCGKTGPRKVSWQFLSGLVKERYLSFKIINSFSCVLPTLICRQFRDILHSNSSISFSSSGLFLRLVKLIS